MRARGPLWRRLRGSRLGLVREAFSKGDDNGVFDRRADPVCERREQHSVQPAHHGAGALVERDLEAPDLYPHVRVRELVRSLWASPRLARPLLVRSIFVRSIFVRSIFVHGIFVRRVRVRRFFVRGLFVRRIFVRRGGFRRITVRRFFVRGIRARGSRVHRTFVRRSCIIFVRGIFVRRLVRSPSAGGYGALAVPSSPNLSLWCLHP
mmetsp:Transcript_16443/g.38738  ORF Transcript_16443/g.38738 Transcript_16443/m.38738 type:complete len:207 (-) Transcript_16443:13-633(-)